MQGWAQCNMHKVSQDLKSGTAVHECRIGVTFDEVKRLRGQNSGFLQNVANGMGMSEKA